MRMRSGRWLLLLPLFAALASCPAFLVPGDNALPMPEYPESPVPLALERITRSLERPVFLTTPPDAPERLFVVEQKGRIKIIEDGTLRESPFLDISDLVGRIDVERGLVGLAFHPNYAQNGYFYVGYTSVEGTTTYARYTRSVDDPFRAERGSAEIILTIPQLDGAHNGGMVLFGPDGYLYIGSGDGGGINDPANNGQSLKNLLGKILRIDVNGPLPYAIPPDNPFVGVTGARAEIWAYGIRNPWRMSFDRLTGDLWIGDVGQYTMEEINFQAADSPGGENYGWSIREGTICRPGENPDDCDLPDAVDPIYAYARAGSKAVAGGYVYRGSDIPELAGTYFFSEFVGASIYSLTRSSTNDVTVVNETANLNDGPFTLFNVVAFGEDGRGELYLVDFGAGAIYKLIAG